MHLKKNYNDFKENWGTGMDDKEKIEAIKELLNGYGSTFSPSHLIENIKSILETGKLHHLK